MNIFSRKYKGTLVWEKLKNEEGITQWTFRTKIPGGWIVTITGDAGMIDASATGATFIPDPEHKWDGNSKN